MPNEAEDEIRRIEAALGADLTRGRDFPTVDPATGRWTGLTTPELPARTSGAATQTTGTGTGTSAPSGGSSNLGWRARLPPPPPPPPHQRRHRSRSLGPARGPRMPGQALPTIDEIRAVGGFELGGLAPPPAARGPPPLTTIPRRLQQNQQTRRPGPPPFGRLAPPPSGRPAPPPPVAGAALPAHRRPALDPARRLERQQLEDRRQEQNQQVRPQAQQQQEQQQTPGPASVAKEGEWSDSSSEYGQSSAPGPLVQGDSTTQREGRLARLARWFSGLARRRGSRGSRASD